MTIDESTIRRTKITVVGRKNMQGKFDILSTRQGGSGTTAKFHGQKRGTKND